MQGTMRPSCNLASIQGRGAHNLAPPNSISRPTPVARPTPSAFAGPAPLPDAFRAPRRTTCAVSAIVDRVETQDLFDSAEEEVTISLKGLEGIEPAAVTARLVVPYFVTSPGQQLFLSGSAPQLGAWDPSSALPFTWNEGHVHTLETQLPAGKLVEFKLMLKENGKPIHSEVKARELLLSAPSKPAQDSETPPATPPSQGMVDPTALPAAAAGFAGAAGAPAATSSPTPQFEVLCVYDQPDVTEVTRLPLVLPPRQAGDESVLCKLVVVPDGVKLEGRQRPVLVGNTPELGNWDPTKGIKLMRQVGGHWTTRASLPLTAQPLQAKVVVCEPTGEAVLWEPGAANRALTLPAGIKPDSHMLIFTCQWSNPGVTPVVAVPVEYESLEKEHVKALEAAAREIGLMRQAMAAKQRQAQQLEQEMQAVRRAERELRADVQEMQRDMLMLVEELEVVKRANVSLQEDMDVALDERDEARHTAEVVVVENAELRREMLALQRQIKDLQVALASASAAPAAPVAAAREKPQPDKVAASQTPPAKSAWRADPDTQHVRIAPAANNGVSSGGASRGGGASSASPRGPGAAVRPQEADTPATSRSAGASSASSRRSTSANWRNLV